MQYALVIFIRVLFSWINKGYALTLVAISFLGTL